MKRLLITTIATAAIAAAAFGGFVLFGGGGSSSASLSPFFDTGVEVGPDGESLFGHIGTLAEEIQEPQSSIALVTITGGKVIQTAAAGPADVYVEGDNAEVAKAEYLAHQEIVSSYPAVSEYTAAVARWIKGSGPSNIGILAYGGWMLDAGQVRAITPILDALPETGRTYVVFLHGPQSDGRYGRAFYGRGIFDVTNGKLRVIDDPLTHDIRQQVQGLTVDQFASLVAAAQ